MKKGREQRNNERKSIRMNQELKMKGDKMK
jgi:hypothetical protein